MAYAALLSLDQTLQQILQSQSHDEYQLLLRKERLPLRSLHGKIHHFMSFLENSSPKYSETISSNLEGKIRDATYEAEDLIELHITKQIKSKPIICGGVVRCFQELGDVLHHCASCLGSSTRQNFEQKLENVILHLNLILEEVEKMEEFQSRNIHDTSVQIQGPSNLQIIEGATKMHPNNLSRAASTNKSVVVGFEVEKLEIKELLVGASSRRGTISIVGMGGIGKTTLARDIYNDSIVNSHFDIRAWTTISQEFNVKVLLADLLNCIGIPIEYLSDHGRDVDNLKLKLYHSFKGRRYLIVMDDVWDSNVLKEIEKILPDDNNGSRLIITSRLSSVASSYNSHIYRLNISNLDQGWNLLCKKAFREETCLPELEDIGKRIAENCEGLPIALMVVGGVLQKAEKTRQQWEYIEKNIKSAQVENYFDPMEILSWSYNQLPYHLRACFLYMGVFREDTVMRVSHLIMLWVANGFIRPASPKTLEEVANEYLEDLIDRSLITVRERYSSGEIKTCDMHDLLRDMCIKKAEEERFLLVADKSMWISPEVLSGYRHLTISQESARPSVFEDVYGSTFRSILCFGGQLKNMPFGLLKVFEARDTIFDLFPVELLQLVNLKYIALVCFKTSEIPSSISELGNLQTLLVFISSRDRKIILPSEILNMPQLRHLWVEGGILHHHSSGGQNENLQTLCGVRNFILTDKGIGIFPNLRSLGLVYDKTEWGSRGLENLVRLYRLEFLKLRIDDSFLKLPFEANLAFPISLRKLSLRGFQLSREQMSTIGTLPNLEVLKLKYVKFDREEGWKTNGSEFLKLKFLLLRRPDKFLWDLEGIVFPSLECLTLDGMYDLDCLPSEFGDIPTLRDINLYNYPSSVVASASKKASDHLQIRAYSGDVYKGKFMDYMLYGR